MIVSNSGLYNIGLDLRRGLTNKRFWSTLGVLAFVFSLFIGLRGIWPLTTYYYGGDAGYRAYVGRMFTQKIIIQSLIDLAVFANYFPFFGAVAFAYTIVDDRRHGYCLQQIQRIGFSKYYWSKLTASGILGGLMGTMCIVLICLLSAILVAWNPFTKEAVAYYNSWTDYDNIIGYVGWGYDGAYFYVGNQWVWWMLGCIKYFVMGTFFGFLAGIIAFYTNNKVILYAGTVIFLLLEDKWLYMLILFCGRDSYISNILSRFFQRANIKMFGNLYHYSLLLFLIILLLNFAIYIQNRVEHFYMEGGSMDD